MLDSKMVTQYQIVQSHPAAADQYNEANLTSPAAIAAHKETV